MEESKVFEDCEFDDPTPFSEALMLHCDSKLSKEIAIKNEKAINEVEMGKLVQFKKLINLDLGMNSIS